MSLKKCPFCAEEINIEAIKCKHCGSNLNEVSQGIPEQKAAVKLESYKGTIIIENPNTKERKKFSVHTGGTWAFLFGIFHMLYHNLFGLAVIWLCGLIIGSIVLSNNPNAIGALFWFNILYCFFAKRKVVNHCLEKGWIVVAHNPK